MRNGIQGSFLDLSFKYAQPINEACKLGIGFFPYIVAAIQHNETNGMPDAATVISGDGGHGLMQLTSSFPDNWKSPYVNVAYAVTEFLQPAETYWAHELQGDDLVRAIAAEYNAGRGNAIAGHESGNLDLFTTNNYAARALSSYHKLLAHEPL